MEMDIYQIDAFADKLFAWNPAAVCPLDSWLSDETMQNMAIENNLSETAFFISSNNGYHIRWFTPGGEVKLSGHATLASPYVIFQYLKAEIDHINFDSLSGLLTVNKLKNGDLELDFPAINIEKTEPDKNLLSALGNKPKKVYKSHQDYLVVYPSQTDIEKLISDFSLLKTINLRGVIATAPGKECDFVSRFFVPKFGIDEDPVTGSAHCILTPYWSNILNKNQLRAQQLSKRGGKLQCRLVGDRVKLIGTAVPYLKGVISI
jgi:PhzF family phenazine biosynthesis protein